MSSYISTADSSATVSAIFVMPATGGDNVNVGTGVTIVEGIVDTIKLLRVHMPPILMSAGEHTKLCAPPW